MVEGTACNSIPANPGNRLHNGPALSAGDLRLLHETADRFASAIRCNILLLSPQGEALVPPAIHNPLCTALRQTAAGLALCTISTVQLMAPAEEESAEYDCPTGMYGLKTSLRLDDEPHLQIVFDGFFRQHPSDEQIHKLASLTGIDPEALTQPAMQVPVFEAAQLRQLTELFQDFVKHQLALVPRDTDLTRLITSLPSQLRPSPGQAIVISDPTGTILQANEAALSAFERNTEQVMGKHLADLYRQPPVLLKPYIALASPAGPLRYQVKLDAGKNGPKHFVVTAYAIGAPPNSIAVHLLEETEVPTPELYWTMGEWADACSYIQAAVVILDLDLTIRHANEKALELTGYSQEEITGRSCEELLALPSREVLNSNRSQLRSLQPRAALTFTLRIVRKDAGVIDVQANFCALPTKEQPALLCALIPLTALPGVSAEEKLRAAKREARLERSHALSQLVGSLAHHINNILVGVVTQLDALRSDLPADHPIARRLEKVQQNSQRIADLISSLALFAGAVPEATTHEDVSELITAAIDRARETIPRDFEYRLDIDPDLPKTRAHRESIVKALSNIISNAIEAAEPDQQILIEISARLVELLPADIDEFPWAKPGTYIRIAIRDNGPGIPPEILPRATDPFVTGKPGHLGLGLSEAHGIIMAHGGILQLLSAPGRGAIARVYLPVEVRHRKPAADQAGLVLLVIEDEDLLTATSLALEEAGHDLISVASPAEALRLFTRYHRDIDLVLVDADLTELPPHEVLSTMLDVAPQARIAIISSARDATAAKRLREQGAVAVIRKPFTADALVSTVKNLIQAEDT